MQKQFKYDENRELTVKLTPQEFITMRNAIGQAIGLCEVTTLPEVRIFVSTKKGEPIKKVSKGQIEKGEVVQVTDPNQTFALDNLKISYDATKITQDMLASNALLERIFKQHVDEGLVKEVVENEQ